jgi:hypothetical protein
MVDRGIKSMVEYEKRLCLNLGSFDKKILAFT